MLASGMKWISFKQSLCNSVRPLGGCWKYLSVESQADLITEVLWSLCASSHPPGDKGGVYSMIKMQPTPLSPVTINARLLTAPQHYAENLSQTCKNMK